MTLLPGSLEELSQTLGQKAADELGVPLAVAGVLPDTLLVVLDDDATVKSLPWSFVDDELSFGEAKTVEGAEAQAALAAAFVNAGLDRETPPEGFGAPELDGFARITGLQPVEAKALGLEADETKGTYVEIPGSWESMLSELRDDVTDLLNPPAPDPAPGQASSTPSSRAYVSIIGTFDDHVLARMTKYNGDADDHTYWNIPWSVTDDGEPDLGVPVAVEISAVVQPLSTPLEEDDPVPPASAFNGEGADQGGGNTPTVPNPEAFATLMRLAGLSSAATG